MNYTPPSGDQADFEIVIYIAPSADQADFDLTQRPGSEINSEIRGGSVDVSSEINSEILGKGVIPPRLGYRIIVKNEAGEIIGELDKYQNLSFSKNLNNYGEASFSIPANDQKTEDLISLRKNSVWIYREDGLVKTLVWAGEMANWNGKLDNKGNNWVTVHCYDWLEQLSARFTTAERVFTDIDAGDIAWTLIDETQSQIRDHALGVGGTDQPITSLASLSLANDGGVGLVSGSPFYQSFIAPATGRVKKLFLFVDEDDSPVIGDRFVSIYTDNGSDAPNTQITDSDKTTAISDDGLVSPFWIELDYSDVDIELVEGTKYWLKFQFNEGTGNVGTAIWKIINGGYITGRIEVPSDSGLEGDLATDGSDVAFRLEMEGAISSEADDADFGITEGTIEATQNRDRTYNNDNIMQKIIDLTNVLNGFDFEITNDKVFNVYALKGTDKSDSVVFIYGTNVTEATIDSNFVTPANRAIVLGQVPDATEMTRVERNDLVSQVAYKLREYLDTASNISENQTLKDHGDAILRKYGVSLLSVDITLASGSSPKITDFDLGDLIRIIIQSGVYNINDVYRVFGYEVKFDGKNVERLSLILGNFTVE